MVHRRLDLGGLPTVAWKTRGHALRRAAARSRTIHGRGKDMLSHILEATSEAQQGRSSGLMSPQRVAGFCSSVATSCAHVTESGGNVAEKEFQAVRAWEVEKVQLHVAHSNGGELGDPLSYLVRIAADDMHIASMAHRPMSH